MQNTLYSNDDLTLECTNYCSGLGKILTFQKKFLCFFLSEKKRKRFLKKKINEKKKFLAEPWYCLTSLGDCREECGDNSTCINECDDSIIECVIHCPCRSECLNGCKGCSGVFCQCHDAGSSEQYLDCVVSFKGGTH